MLDADEARQVSSQQLRGLVTLDMESVRKIFEEYGGDADGLHKRLEFEREWGGVLREYRRITGFPETNPLALYHHQIDQYGPPCRSCGKPLRTPEAKMCGACMMPVALERAM